MVEQLKFTVGQLERPPFNRKDYNILTFGNLTDNQLLQVLTDVSRVINPYNPAVVFPILQWLLEKVSEHKEPAYLGQNLSKIDIPAAFSQ